MIFSKNLKSILAVLLLLAVSSSGNTHIETLKFDNIWARATPPGIANSAIYLTIHNTSNEPEILVDANTAAADKAELHNHINQDGMMKMRQVKHIEVPANGMVALKPHGLHIMLFNITEPLVEGDNLHIELVFEKGDPIALMIPVLKDAPDGAMHGGTHKKKH